MKGPCKLLFYQLRIISSFFRTWNGGWCSDPPKPAQTAWRPEQHDGYPGPLVGVAALHLAYPTRLQPRAVRA